MESQEAEGVIGGLMAKRFEDLPRFMNRTRAQFVAGATAIVKQTAQTVDENVVRGTPVDTGRARSNWVVTKNAPFGGVIPPYSPGTKLGISETGNAAGAIGQGSLVIATFRLLKDTTIYITNNIGYVRKLNDGSSTQAPAGFIEAAIQAGAALIRGKRVIGRRVR